MLRGDLMVLLTGRRQCYRNSLDSGDGAMVVGFFSGVRGECGVGVSRW